MQVSTKQETNKTLENTLIQLLDKYRVACVYIMT